MAVRAFNSSEALVKISAFKILSHHMGDYRAVKPILLLEKFITFSNFHREVSCGFLLLYISTWLLHSIWFPFYRQGGNHSSGISHFSYIGRGIEGILSSGILLLKLANDGICPFHQDLLWWQMNGIGTEQDMMLI